MSRIAVIFVFVVIVVFVLLVQIFTAYIPAGLEPLVLCLEAGLRFVHPRVRTFYHSVC